MCSTRMIESSESGAMDVRSTERRFRSNTLGFIEFCPRLVDPIEHKVSKSHSHPRNWHRSSPSIFYVAELSFHREER